VIEEYGFRNFRAFSLGTVHVRPITVLLGANGQGKTSVLQPLLIMKQTLEAPEENAREPLRLNGRLVNYGPLQNVFHNGDTSKPLMFSFRISSESLASQIKNAARRLLDSLRYTLSFYARELDLLQRQDEIPDRGNPTIQSIIDRRGSSYQEPESIDELVDSLASARKLVRELSSRRSHSDPGLSRLLGSSPFNASEEELRSIGEYSKELQTVNQSEFTISLLFRHVTSSGANRRSELSLSRVIIQDRARSVVRATRAGSSDEWQFDSDLTSAQRKQRIVPAATRSSFEVTFAVEDGRQNPVETPSLADIFRRILHASLRELAANFRQERVAHVGPIRDRPRRYYLLDETIEGRRIQGETFSMLRDSEAIRRTINEWFEEDSIRFETTDVADLLGQIKVYEREGLDALTISDTGFGYSQLLPILLTGFSAKPGVTMVFEQPEAHLHPAMQARLCNMMVKMASNGQRKFDKRIIIETHSEYFLKRLRRMIKEGKEIGAEDVAIYFVERDPKTREPALRPISVASDGDFEWPESFYRHVLEDNLVFLS
jgi:hypothetical protein